MQSDKRADKFQTWSINI